jgi:hypothetical protein
MGQINAPELSITDSAIEALSHNSIFFGHQSVGASIIQGIEELFAEKKAALTIGETRLDTSNGPILVHARIGKNGDPISKIDDFAEIIKHGMGSRVNIALFKFCYIDFNPETKPAVIFGHYDSVMTSLAAEFPSVRFIHCTAPLEECNHGLKGTVKNLLGKRSNELANIKRHEYNELVRARFCAEGNIYDIARVESVWFDGARENFKLGGKGYPALVPLYSSDGGHVNEDGRKKLAVEWVRVVAGVQ